MENASKALLIAGGMLLFMLVLSFMSYMFGRMANSAAEVYEEMEDSEIAEFNQQFLNYNGGGTKKDADGNWINPLRIQDVITLINLAKSSNESGKMPIIIEVSLNGSKLNLSNINSTYIKNLLEKDLEGENWNSDKNGKKYSCKIQFDIKDPRMIKTVTIKELK